MSEKEQAESLGSPDWILLGATLALLALGLMMAYSASSDAGYRLENDAAYYFKRQFTFLGIGLVGMVIAIRMHYKLWMKLSILIMISTLLLLLFLVLSDKGRHLFGGQSGSPVELAKLAVVIYIGHWLSSKGELLRKLPYGLLPFTIMVGLVTGLVMAQPDLSEALVIVLVSVVMFFLAGADVVQFGIGLVGGATVFASVIGRLPHALERLQGYMAEWRDPMLSDNYHLIMGIRALGSGGLRGFGPGNGRMKYQWLPAAQTDSIFSILGEELGLLGCLLVIGLLVVVIYRGLRTASRAPDAFGQLLAVGITCWIAFQSLINMAVVTGVIPFTGIALPFISVGGSSLVTCTIGVGIMLSVSRTIVREGAVSHEARGLGRWNRGTRLPRPDRHQSTA
jgi:cell division protein FtsW